MSFRPVRPYSPSFNSAGGMVRASSADSAPELDAEAKDFIDTIVRVYLLTSSATTPNWANFWSEIESFENELHQHTIGTLKSLRETDKIKLVALFTLRDHQAAVSALVSPEIWNRIQADFSDLSGYETPPPLPSPNKY